MHSPWMEAIEYYLHHPTRKMCKLKILKFSSFYLIFYFLDWILQSFVEVHTTFKALTLSNFSPQKMEQSKNCLDFATIF